MSEAEAEVTFEEPEAEGEPETDDEVEEPETAEPDESDDDDEGDEGEEEEQAAEEEPAASGPRDEKELEALRKKLDNEDERHAKRVGDLFEDAAADLIQCPMCMHNVSGWIFNPQRVPFPEENVALMKTFLGVPVVPDYKEHDSFSTCGSCAGLGQIRTGSKVPGYETSQCPRCVGKGWVGSLAEVPPPPPPAGTDQTTGPTVQQPQEPSEDDPAIAALRAKGFAVIPPMNLNPPV